MLSAWICAVGWVCCLGSSWLAALRRAIDEWPLFVATYVPDVSVGYELAPGGFQFIVLHVHFDDGRLHQQRSVSGVCVYNLVPICWL